VFYTLAEIYRAATMYQSAAESYRRALAIDPTLVEARARLALSLAELGYWPEADHEARLALAGNTHSAMSMLSILRLAHAASTHPVVLSDRPIVKPAPQPPSR
jgi:tetratricopeptide (TPR) repeat protein